MVNYDGVRIVPRSTNYVIEVNERWYYYDRILTLRGHFETKEEAVEALRKEWGKEDIKELE